MIKTLGIILILQLGCLAWCINASSKSKPAKAVLTTNTIFVNVTSGDVDDNDNMSSTEQQPDGEDQDPATSNP
jgi:hypothetical protein